MKFIKTVACPVCGKLNEVPDNLEELVGTVAFRSNKNYQNKITVIEKYLSDLRQNIRERVINLLEKNEKIDPNDWLDIECLNNKKPHGQHTFRFNLKTGDVST